MNILVMQNMLHNKEFNLYSLLKNSNLSKIHSFIYIYENLKSNKSFLNHLVLSDLILIDISYPSIKLLIDLKWSFIMNKNIILTHNREYNINLYEKLLGYSYIDIEYISCDDLVKKLNLYFKI